MPGFLVAATAQSKEKYMPKTERFVIGAVLIFAAVAVILIWTAHVTGKEKRGCADCPQTLEQLLPWMFSNNSLYPSEQPDSGYRPNVGGGISIGVYEL